MATYQSKLIENKKNWEKFVLSQKPQSFLQSWNWGETNKLLGNQVIRLGFFNVNRRLVGCAQVIIERARRGPYFLIPGGPLIDWSNKSLVSFVLKELKNLAFAEKVWFIRLRPEVSDSPDAREKFKKLGFIKSPMHLHAQNTWVLRLKPEEEEILAAMRKTTRYLIRQSLSKGLEIEEHKSSDMAPMLYKLQEETVKRHKFVPFSQKLFEAQLETFGQDNQASLFVCKLKSEVLAAAIIVFYGDYAYYHHSGSVSTHRDLPFSYFMQWNIIKVAKKRGKTGYNFWGIAPTDDPRHRFYGVTIFKKGFGGERIDWLPAQDLPISPLYWLTYMFEKGRRVSRGL